jgi:hypothetical protein
MKVDVFLESGVCVEVPDGTDLDSDEGYLIVKAAAATKFLEMLHGDGFDVQAEEYREPTGTRTGYAYRYVTDEGNPALTCPHCGQDWTAAGGIEIEVSVAAHTAHVVTRLDEEGHLEDTPDDAVAHGHDAGTYCGSCWGLLAEMEGVNEWSA